MRWLAIAASLGVLLAVASGLAGLARLGYGPLRVLLVAGPAVLGILAVAGGVLLVAWLFSRRL